VDRDASPLSLRGKKKEKSPPRLHCIDEKKRKSEKWCLRLEIRDSISVPGLEGERQRRDTVLVEGKKKGEE